MTVSSPSRKRVLVTGAAGNVGSKLCQHLLDSGHAVVGVDNFFSGYRSNLAPFEGHPEFAFHERSITEPGLLESLISEHGRFGAVLHMAAVVSVPYSMEHPEETMAVNHSATLTLHSQARGMGVPAFVFAGSAAEYGLPIEGAASEDMAGEPQSPYGWAKYLSSKHIASSGFGCSLRFFNLYGPARGKPGPYDGVVRRFMAMALNGEPLTIFGDGEQTRDFVYVFDAVKAVLLAGGLWGDAGPLSGVFNVGTGRSTTVTELAMLLARLAGKDLPISYLPERAGDLRHSLADVSRLEREGGFRPSTMLEDGLRTTMDWFSANRAELV
ncbi:MAG: NAD-dependent epimerase/dehydratase family protein [Thermodesulfobacteriota bacterium]